MTAVKKTAIFLKRVIYVVSTAIALGFTWGLVETITNRYWPAVGTFRNPYFLQSVNDRAVFYSLVSLIIFVLSVFATTVISKASRVRDYWPVVYTTSVFAVVYAGATANAFFLFKSDMGLWHYFEVLANSLEPFLEDNMFPGYLIMTAAGTLLSPVFVIFIRRPGWRKLSAAFVALAVAMFAVLQAAEIVIANGRPVPEGLPDVYVITIDAGRADRFTPEVMPEVTGFAYGSCIVYERAYAPSSWTAPSFGSFATGQYPDVCMVGGAALGNAQPTLAEVMYENGYDTYFFTGNPVLDRPRGLHRGFEHHRLWSYSPELIAIRFYDTDMLNTLTRDVNDLRPAGAVNAAITVNALEVIRKRSKRPKFAWFHYMDPHWPYHPVPKYVRDEFKTYAEDAAFCFNFDYATEENLEIIDELYTAEVRALDDEVMTLITAIENENDGPAVIIFTSDHGEELGEHGLIGEHGKTAYQEVMLVPFFVKFPKADGRKAPAKVARPVNLVDLAPSVLNYVGFYVPRSMQGRSLFDRNSEPETDEIILFGSWVQTDEYLYGAVAGDRKLILSDKDIAGGTRGEYYDLAADPRETAPLPYDETAERLRDALIDWKAENDTRRAAQDEGVMPKPTEVDLKGLGYVD